jgi:hypothetical protein
VEASQRSDTDLRNFDLLLQLPAEAPVDLLGDLPRPEGLLWPLALDHPDDELVDRDLTSRRQAVVGRRRSSRSISGQRWRGGMREWRNIAAVYTTVLANGEAGQRAMR